MTTAALEVKDGITEFLSQCDADLAPIQENKTENINNKHITNDVLLQQLEDINSKFDHYANRLDKLETERNAINLNENPETPEYKSLHQYITHGHQALECKNIFATSATVPDTNFSYLIPKKIHLHFDKLLSQNSIMRKLCSIEKISSDSLEYLISNNQETFVGWSGDPNTLVSKSLTPKLSHINIRLFELYAQPQLAKNLLEDTCIDLERWLMNNLVDAFSRKENKAFISGSGTSQPTGILSYDEGTGPGQIERVKVETLNTDAIIKLFYSLNENFSSRAAFLMNRSILQEIRSLKSNTGQYLLQVGNSGDEMLLGIPVYQTSDMPMYSDGSNSIIAIADFKSAYKIVENKDMRILRDPYTEKSFVKFYTTKRIGGAAVNCNAIKLLTVTRPTIVPKINKSSAAKSPVAELPIAQSSVAVLPVAKSPVAELPVSEVFNPETLK
ncbi:Phage capsid family protein [Anaplasma phagocytophilum]|uniref:phage major capsid protein n=1 Tax=Anaplasma phagocytophilum TaxID=948 RepID=UPI0007E1410B|nr:phage major capsid protein [Anaplasma phagocytophilum]SCV61616.1 Phage capsid family protein [Anaplasma phagocytophilum]